MSITGKDLIAWGHQPGAWFATALPTANQMLAQGRTLAEIQACVAQMAPPPVITIPLQAAGVAPLHINIDAEDEHEAANVADCVASMRQLLRTPVVRAAALMPDACPAGPPGTIPVGGVVASEHIHPGMHSADICCSLAFSNFGRTDPKLVLDTALAVTHFGPGGRSEGSCLPLPDGIAEAIDGHPMFNDKARWRARTHFATQGDGNHFLFVGQSKATGETIVVTHHGSRGAGAALYKHGMAIAEAHTRVVAPDVLKQNCWIEADSADGEAYWQALQIMRAWTKANHFAIHDRVGETLGVKAADRFWNEHNFVFRKSDGLFYHGKGATPAFDGWAEDATDLTLIPLNMAEPVLVVRGRNAAHGLGFSPHGAGRNWSRSAHMRALGDTPLAEVIAAETKGLDVRFYCGRADVSELPSAYKRAATVRAQIERYQLAEVVDEILPYGSIMAGEILFQRKPKAPPMDTD